MSNYKNKIHDEAIKGLTLRPKLNKDSTQEEISEVVDELRVHQIELEEQNDELRVMQHRLEEIRDKYTDLFDFAPVGYFIIDKKGIVINVNLTGSALLGLDRSRIKGKPFSAFLANTENNSNTFFKHLRGLSQDDTIQSCELLLKRKGGRFSAQIDSVAETDLKAEEIYYRMTLRDLSGEKKSEEIVLLNKELKLEKDKVQQYLQLSGQFMVALDEGGKITMINRAGCDILGLMCHEKNRKCIIDENRVCQIEGINWFERFIPKNQKKKAKAYFDQMIKKKAIETNQYENYILTTSGGERLMSWAHSHIENNEGKFIGILSSGIDITEQRKAENAVIESEQMFRKLFETATESIVITNDKGEIVKANKITKKLFGYRLKELIGQRIETLIPERLKEKHINSLKSRGLADRIDIYAKKKNGEEFPVEVSFNTIENNNEQHKMVLITDITERKKSKEKLENLNAELELKVKERTRELKESQRMYQTIARNFPNGVINVFDKNLNYVFVEGMEMFKVGITGEMLIGTNFIDRIDPRFRVGLKKKLLSVFNGKELNFELEIEKTTYLINAVGLLDVNDKIFQILMVTQNITNLKQAEEVILKSLGKEQHLNELKSRFVSMASHEFRTPLTTIMNSISLLSRYIGKQENEDRQLIHVERVKSSIRHLTNMLNDFLSLDKLEGGKVEVCFSEIDIQEFSQNVVDKLGSMLKEGQQIKYHHQGGGVVKIDVQMLRNIYNNLLSNAIKYSPIDSSIEFVTIADEKSLIIIVQDKGIGIAKDEQEHMFERFFRAKNAVNTQGTGLGLNIVKKYLDMAGGEISFKSTLNKGAMFTVKLPINNAVRKTNNVL